jgi:hypothetical protein
LPQTKTIEIIHSAQLDPRRWDECVTRGEGLIYSRYWYVDAMADDWYGLVWGDYECVMPLPVKKKFGIKMLTNPAFMQRCDSSHTLDPEQCFEVGNRLRSFAGLIHLNLSQQGVFPKAATRQRTNFILDLTLSYASIFDNYSESCRKNLRKAVRRGCVWSEKVSINDVLQLYQQAYGSVSSYGTTHYEKVLRLLHAAEQQDACRLGAVYDEKGEMVYAGLVLDDGRRLYYLMGAPTEKGREMRATYFFIDSIIRQFAEKRLVFDFEGSDIPDVARFYQSFSPATEHYYEYYLNNYPFPLNRLLDRRLKPF